MYSLIKSIKGISARLLMKEYGIIIIKILNYIVIVKNTNYEENLLIEFSDIYK